MSRTTTTAVKILLARNYDCRVDLQQFVDTAAVIIDDIAAEATAQAITLGGKEELIHRYLAAHFYQQSDPGFTSKSTADASGSFQGQFTQGLKSTRYGQSALLLDPTGVLAQTDGQVVAKGLWLGRNERDQTPVDER